MNNEFHQVTIQIQSKQCVISDDGTIHTVHRKIPMQYEITFVKDCNFPYEYKVDKLCEYLNSELKKDDII